MPNLLTIDGGQITIVNPDGSVRFTTQEPMFHVTNTVSGSINIGFPFMPATQNLVRNASYNLGAINPSATHVFGTLQTTGDSYGRLPGGTWFDAGGTYVHRIHWMSEINSEIGNRANFPNHTVFYDFRASGGTLWLDERLFYESYDTNGLQSILPESLSSFTMTYKLKIGLFT